MGDDSPVVVWIEFPPLIIPYLEHLQGHVQLGRIAYYSWLEGLAEYSLRIPSPPYLFLPRETSPAVMIFGVQAQLNWEWQQLGWEGNTV